MLADDGGDALLAGGEDVEPEQHSPEPVLLAHVIRAGAGAFLAADADKPGIKQVAEELPAGRRLEAGNAKRLCHPVSCLAGGHGAGDAGEAPGIAGCQAGIGREHGEAVGWRDELAAPDDQVAVSVAI